MAVEMMLTEHASQSEEVVFEYWAGNPSVEIDHGHLHTSTSASSSVVLASSVPCHMAPTDFCQFLGAFDEPTHRCFRHFRVLHGVNSDEYLIALWLASEDVSQNLIDQYGGKQYNALENDVCALHRVLACKKSTYAVEDTRTPMKPCVASPLLRSPAMKPQAMWSPSCGPARSPSPVLSEPPALGPLASDLENLFLDCESLRGCDERAFCAVCLEQIDLDPEHYQITEMGGGTPLTILCGHTFHSRCLSRWCDTTCPVCRYQQHPYRMSSCDVCGSADGLHVCLVCGFISCTEQQHAQQHFEATSHTYAIEVSSQRVWDYSGNGYVHRLLFNHEDGKVVEHSVPVPEDEALPAGSAAASMPSAGGRRRWADMAEEDDDCADDCAEWARDDARLDPSKKSHKESVVSEFNALLASQMTAQRKYYEERQREQERQHRQRLREHEASLQVAEEELLEAQQHLQEAGEANLALEAQIAKVTADEEKARRQIKALEGLNEKISAEQRSYEDKCEDKRQEKKAAKQRRAKEVEELQQQIRDLQLFLQMQKRCSTSADAADLQESHLVVTEATGPQRGRGGNRRGTRRR